MNELKFILLHDENEDNVMKDIFDMLRVASSILNDGFTYLGFKAKPEGYYN